MERPRRRGRVTRHGNRPADLKQPSAVWLLRRSCELQIDQVIAADPWCSKESSQLVDRLLAVAEASF